MATVLFAALQEHVSALLRATGLAVRTAELLLLLLMVALSEEPLTMPLALSARGADAMASCVVRRLFYSCCSSC